MHGVPLWPRVNHARTVFPRDTRIATYTAACLVSVRTVKRVRRVHWPAHSRQVQTAIRTVSFKKAARATGAPLIWLFRPVINEGLRVWVCSPD